MLEVYCANGNEAQAGAVEVGLEIAKVHGICGSLWVICYVYHLGLVQFIHVGYPTHDALAGGLCGFPHEYHSYCRVWKIWRLKRDQQLVLPMEEARNEDSYGSHPFL